jgi:hypothetical protein
MRAAAACVAACLLVLQGFAFACHSGPSASGDGAAGAAVAAIAQGAHCSASDDAGVPTQGHDAACCAYCAATHRDLLAQFISVVVVVITERPPPVIAGLSYRTDGADFVPLGWTSSWSSRAPPQFG